MTIFRVIILVLSLVAIVPWACLADQLQWNPLFVCRAAVGAIVREPLLVSYCSQADADHVELWLVRDFAIVSTPVRGLHEVMVSAERFYRSESAYSSEEFPTSEEQWALHEVDDAGRLCVGMDLAYVYVHVGGGSFRCLGRMLGLDCVVGVEAIQLPDCAMKEISAFLERKHDKALWPLDLYPGRMLHPTAERGGWRSVRSRPEPSPFVQGFGLRTGFNHTAFLDWLSIPKLSL